MVLPCDRKPCMHQFSQLMLRLIPKGCDSIPHCLVDDSNHLLHCTISSLMSPLISLLPHMIDACLKDHFDEDLV